MAGYGGYFLKGLGQGISQGMEWGTNILNIRAQKKARDDAETLKEKITLQSQELMAMINEYGTEYTDEEASHIRTYANASVAEVQAQFKPYLDDIESGRLKQAEIKRKEISEFYDYVGTLNLTPGQVTQTLDNFKKNYTSEGALNFLKAEERMLKAKTEAREMQPTVTTPEVFKKFQSKGLNKIKAVIIVAVLASLIESQALPKPSSRATFEERPALISSLYLSKIRKFESTAIPTDRRKPAIPGRVRVMGINL